MQFPHGQVEGMTNASTCKNNKLTKEDKREKKKSVKHTLRIHSKHKIITHPFLKLYCQWDLAPLKMTLTCRLIVSYSNPYGTMVVCIQKTPHPPVIYTITCTKKKLYFHYSLPQSYT